jgi:hypothetical protein
MFDEFKNSLMNTYIQKNPKSNILMKNKYVPTLHAFSNTNLDYRFLNLGTVIRNGIRTQKLNSKKKKIKLEKENYLLFNKQDQRNPYTETDENTKKLEIFLNAKKKALKNFDQKIRSHLKNEEILSMNINNNKVIKNLYILTNKIF